MPNEKDFKEYAIQNNWKVDDTYLLYDQVGTWAATRGWFMLIAFGAKNVYVMDGSFSKWKAEERKTEEG